MPKVFLFALTVAKIDVDHPNMQNLLGWFSAKVHGKKFTAHLLHFDVLDM